MATQEADIKAAVAAAIEKEQKAIAGDQFYREALMALAMKVRDGTADKYVFEVGQEEYERFQKENPITPTKKKAKKEKPDA